MSLSFSPSVTDVRSSEESYHIARVSCPEGTYNNMKIFYVADSVELRQEAEIGDVAETIGKMIDEATKKFRIFGLNNKKLIEIERDILAQQPPTDRYSRRIYSEVIERFGALESKFYRVPPRCTLEVYPRGIPSQVDRLFVAGPSGSGKSTFASMYALNYQRMYPGNRVFIFSRKESDPVLDGRVPGLIRVKLDRQFASSYSRTTGDEPLTEYGDSLLIFDDYEMISDPTIAQAMEHLKNSALELGRAKGISTISIRHKLLSGAKSKVEFIEATHYVIFPASNLGECMKVLKGYCHYSSEQIQRIFDDEGKTQRWMCIVRPDIIITSSYIKIIR